MTGVAATAFVLAVMLVTSLWTSAYARRDPSDAGRKLRTRRVACARDFSNEPSDDALLACISPLCRDAIYGEDPLEEGEFCHRRMALFEACVREEILGRPPKR